MILDKKIKVTLKESDSAPPLAFSNPSHSPTKNAFATIINTIDKSLKY